MGFSKVFSEELWIVVDEELGSRATGLLGERKQPLQGDKEESEEELRVDFQSEL